MADTKFTPGPWEIGHIRFKTHRSVYASGRPGSLIAEVNAVTSEADPTDANAHLIAAAPDLYAALETALDRMEGENARSEYGFEDAMEAARAALAKARGEQ